MTNCLTRPTILFPGRFSPLWGDLFPVICPDRSGSTLRFDNRYSVPTSRDLRFASIFGIRYRFLSVVEGLVIGYLFHWSWKGTPGKIRNRKSDIRNLVNPKSKIRNPKFKIN